MIKFNQYYLELNNILKELKCDKINEIDYISINHVTSRINTDNIFNEPIYNLANALINENELSAHLRKYKIKFKYDTDKNCILMFQNGVQCTFDTNDGRLYNRFGYNKSFNDYCINGYMFIDKLVMDSIRSYLGSPEILKDISCKCSNTNIADDIEDNAHNYVLTFRASINNIHIDDAVSNLSNYQKTEQVIKYSILFLAHKKIANYNFDNPIIYLEENHVVSPNDILKLFLLDYQKPYLIPIEISAK